MEAINSSHWLTGCVGTTVSSLTIVGVPDAVLQDGVPLLLFILRHCTEIVMTGVGVPED